MTMVNNIYLIPLMFSLLVLGCSPQKDKEDGFEDIRKLGGKVVIDSNNPNNVRVTIKLIGPEFDNKSFLLPKLQIPV
jgi:hypothetical protein